MAGDWIKIENVTPDKPEVFAIAEKLGIDPDAVTGKLVRIWIWADQQTITGDARSVTRASLDRLACVTGFADAMISVRWLEQTDGGFRFVNFDRHNGETAKTRGLAAKRNAALRKRRHESDAASVTSASPREEREREKKEEEPPLPPLGEGSDKPKPPRKRRPRKPPFNPIGLEIPASLQTIEFQAAWQRWIAYRCKRAKPLIEENWIAQLKLLEGWGVNAAIASITQSIAGNYMGLFEPRNNGHQSPQQPKRPRIPEPGSPELLGWRP